jgi:hypothetical protein
MDDLSNVCLFPRVRNGSERIRNAEEFKQHPLFVSQQFLGESKVNGSRHDFCNGKH